MGNWRATAVVRVKRGDTDSGEDKGAEGADTGDNGEDGDDGRDGGGELGGTGVWPSTTEYGYGRNQRQNVQDNTHGLTAHVAHF